jgi:hypothetical protein
MASQPESGPKGIAFWDLDVDLDEDGDQRLPAPVSVQPVIRTSGVVDVLFPDEQPDARKPVREADARPGGKYHCLFSPLGSAQKPHYL